MDKFDPENIRSDRGDLSELISSMKAHGWLEHLPAIQNKHGKTLVGNRRIEAAKQLDIKPRIIKVDLSEADQAALAIASNMGGKGMSIDERKRIAAQLYDQPEWTQERIAAALNVSQMTISRDVANLNTVFKSKQPKTKRNPKGSGRPKGTGKKRPEPQELIAKRDKIIALADAGVSANEIAKEVGYTSSRPVYQILEHEKIRREVQGNQVDDNLSKSARERLETAIRRYKRQLDTEFEVKLRERLVQTLDEFYLPDFNKQLADAEEVIKSRKGVFTKEQFRLILAALHTDRSLSQRKQEQAFNIFKEKQLVLVSEKEIPAEILHGFPNTHAEWTELKRKTSAARKKQPA